MDPVTLQRHVELDISADELWSLVAEPDRLADWFAESVALPIEPGGTGTIVDDGIERFVHVDHVEAGRSVGFTWWEDDGAPSRVELRIVERASGGSRLEITETFDPSARATIVDTAEATMRWEVRVGALWACTVVAALVM